MMIIYGQSLPILGILPILLSILTTIPTIMALPSKKLINLDISEEPRSMVEVILSEAYPGGINYAIKPYAMSKYILGTVRDGQEVLMDGDPTAMSRYIFVVTREDGLRYVRIITRWNRDGYGHSAHVREFLKLTGSPYRELKRDPADMDILSQEDDQFISVTRSQEHPTIHYTIKSQFWVTNTIGVVKYGHHIVEDRLEGLMERKVTWYGGVDRPIIIITSKYHNGIEVTIKYEFISGQGFKMVDYRKRTFLLHG